MSHDARAVANVLIDRANEMGRPLTTMQIIKLVYICHGWMLGLYQRPLIHQPVEAWRYGPVISKLYHSLKRFGGGHVTERIPAEDSQFDDLEDDLIRQVVEKYSHLSGISLSSMTHAHGTPWHKVWNMEIPASVVGQNPLIPNDLIEEHYAQKAAS